MGLLDEAMEDCTMIDRRTVSDGYGGFEAYYTDGAPFVCATTLDTSMQARIAQKQGVTNLYTATTKKNVNLRPQDMFRREKDGKIFIVTSDGSDKVTPPSAGLDMRVVSCKEYTVEGGDNGQSTGD